MQAYNISEVPAKDITPAMHAICNKLVDMFSFRRQKKVKANKVLYELVVDLELCLASPCVQDEALIPDIEEEDAPQLSEDEMNALLAEMHVPKMINTAISDATARFRCVLYSIRNMMRIIFAGFFTL